MEIIKEISVDNAEAGLPRLTEEVRVKLQGNHQLTIPSECTGFIVRCLRIKDYDVEKATKLVKNFSKAITQLTDILDKFQPKFYKDLFYSGAFTVLNSRDALGRQIIVSRLGKWDPKAFDFDDAACASMLLFSFIVGQSTETQRNGIVFVHDLSEFSMQHVKAIKPGRLTQLVGLMQDGSPGRIKGVHLIFHPKVFGILYQLVKPFLKEKLSSRIHFHNDDLSSLHKHLNPEILPTYLGGHLRESESVDLPLLEKLINEGSIHKQLKEYSVPSL